MNRYILILIYLVTCLSFFLPEWSGVEATEIGIRGTIGGSKDVTKAPEEGKSGVSGRKEEYAKPKANEMELNRLPHLGNGNTHQTYVGEYVSLVSLFLIVWRWINHKLKLGIYR